MSKRIVIKSIDLESIQYVLPSDAPKNYKPDLEYIADRVNDGISEAFADCLDTAIQMDIENQGLEN